ncbi:fibronectin type 3 and ankyrin repeat domains protein [Fusarium proliferatum]|nr:fibronectin type 3 and ankyrin repeat domains protein [Fusarium proliferatum]
MAEAIGLVASVASLLDLALKLSNALHNLQFQLRNAPYLIQALENETEAVRTVLASVESSIHSTATAGLGGAGSPGILGDLTAEIGKGAAVLKELGTFIDSLKNETSTLRRMKWIQKKKKAAELINELKEVRYRISELQLAYGNSSLTRIGLVLQDIQVMQRRHYAETHNLETCLLDTKDQLTIDRDTTCQNQSDIAAALEALQNTTPKLPQEWVETISNQLATTINTTRPGLAKDNITHVLPHQSQRRQSPQAICSPLQQLTLSFNLRLVQTQCSINCTCRCHASVASYRPWNTLPKMLQMITGPMFLEYSSCPVSRATCDLYSCSKSRRTRLMIRYGFPFWSFKYAIHILVDKVSTRSLMFTLALRRKIPLKASRDNIIYQAATGNLSAVKRIVFENPTAIMDVDYDGESALYRCIMSFLPWELSLQICEVLLQAGADPDQVNDGGLSFRHAIANLVLQKTIPSTLHSRVEGLVQISPCLEDLDFTFIHEIVVKRCPIDLAPVLKTSKADIMAQIHSEDRFGMNPLMYAVALGDAKAAEALIEAGASVHKKGPYGRSLIDYVACLPPITCTALLDLLLAAGANAIEVFPTGWSLLHTAAIYDNVTMIDRLLQEGAQADCIGPRGNRPIHYAASHDSVNSVRLLYEKGTDLNALADNGLSALGVAIRDNATDAQAALLELGADHTITGDWGTHFHVAAYRGSQRTFNTLSCLKFRGLDVDARDAQGLTATDVFENRYDNTDELTKAFYQLKDSIKSKPSDGILDENEDGDIDEFFDALEFLHYGGSR